MRGRRGVVLGALLLVACGPGGGEATPEVQDGAGPGAADPPRPAETAATGPSADAEPSGGRLPALWNRDRPAFGIFVPDEAPGAGGLESPARYTAEGAARLAADSLYDFLFLNLEGTWDPEAVSVVARGVREAGSERPDLLVRIPPIARDGEAAAGQRVREVLSRGADGVVLPHVRNAGEARTAVALFRDAGADVWSPDNPAGRTVAMLMVEDPGALAELEEIAHVGGYSVLACGIGSLTRALGGDREAAEAANRRVLEAARRAGMADMITADTSTVARRVREGFLALLMQGPAADAAIREGRATAGR